MCVVVSLSLIGTQAEKVLLFSQDTNLTALLLEAKDLEARVIILSARLVRVYTGKMMLLLEARVIVILVSQS